MELKFNIMATINKKPSEAYNAVVKREMLCKYFTKSSSENIEKGKTILWEWEGYPSNEVEIAEAEQNRLIVFKWVPDGKNNVTARMHFSPEGTDKTILKISEGTWPEHQDGLNESYGNNAGWQHFAMCLKAYLEYNIDLRR